MSAAAISTYFTLFLTVVQVTIHQIAGNPQILLLFWPSLIAGNTIVYTQIVGIPQIAIKLASLYWGLKSKSVPAIKMDFYFHITDSLQQSDQYTGSTICIPEHQQNDSAGQEMVPTQNNLDPDHECTEYASPASCTLTVCWYYSRPIDSVPMTTLHVAMVTVSQWKLLAAWHG